tara:strand:+ start:227 stop:373 length:147 start_codon:yes stop_codon:yes gene_type:complete
VAVVEVAGVTGLVATTVQRVLAVVLVAVLVVAYTITVAGVLAVLVAVQ